MNAHARFPGVGRLCQLVLLAGVAFLILATPVLACPTCKVALANHGPGQGDLVKGFFWSILFMLSMPFATFGGLSGYFYWQVKKARAAQAVKGATPTRIASDVAVIGPAAESGTADHVL